MLGRVKIGVDAALAAYEELGSQIFGHPRLMHVRSVLWWPKSKYNHRKFLEILQRAVEKAVPRAQDGQTNDYYPQPNPNDCKTCEITYIPSYAP
jgi:hypothetical protein